MEKITLGELINKYNKDGKLGVTILNDDGKKTVAKICMANKVPEEFKNRIVKCFSMLAINSRATAFDIEVILK